MGWHVQQVGHDCLELVTGVRPTGYLLQIQADTRESSDKTREKCNFSRYYLLIEIVETLKYVIEDNRSSGGSGTAAMRWLLSTDENRGEISRDRDRCVRFLSLLPSRFSRLRFT